MNIICKIFGHKWDKTDKYRQECKRNYCLATRYLAIDKIKHAFGEKCISWEIIDIDDIKIRQNNKTQ